METRNVIYRYMPNSVSIISDSFYRCKNLCDIIETWYQAKKNGSLIKKTCTETGGMSCILSAITLLSRDFGLQ